MNASDIVNSVAEMIKNRVDRMPKEHDDRCATRRWLAHDVGEYIREMLQALPEDLRKDTLICSAICLECGKDNSPMYEQRSFYMCTCKGE